MPTSYPAAPSRATFPLPHPGILFSSERAPASRKSEPVFGAPEARNASVCGDASKGQESSIHAGCSPVLGGSLGKNRHTPPSAAQRAEPDSSSFPSFDSLPLAPVAVSRRAPNRALVRVATASRLMAGHWASTGENLAGSSVMGCGRWRAYGSDPLTAEIEVPHGGHPRMLGHFICGGTWVCDPCARARVAQVRSWTRAALIPALDAHGMTGALVTLTLAHSYEDDWAQVVHGLLRAFSLMDRRMSKAYKKIGSMGKLRALEAPVGRHGLHPHLHLLLTYKKGADLAGIEVAMRDAWNVAVGQVGGRCNEHGFDFKPDCVNDYVAKMEVSHELASHGTKQARGKGLLLGQLLDRAAVNDEKSAAEWVRAVAALGGRNRFQAGGLPKKLGILSPSEWEDTQRGVERAEAAALLPEPVRITYPQERHMRATGTAAGRAGLAMILRSSRTADPVRVVRVVAALCAEVDRKESGADAGQQLARCTDADYQAVVDAAAVRRLQPSEVPMYLSAKRRGFTCAAVAVGPLVEASG